MSIVCRLVVCGVGLSIVASGCARLGFRSAPSSVTDGAVADQPGGPVDAPGADHNSTTDAGARDQGADLGPLALTVAWSKRIGGDGPDRGSRVAVDGQGNAFLVGSFSKSMTLGATQVSSKGGHDVYVISFDPAGTHRWSKTFGTTQSDYCTGVAVDAAGNVYIHGDGGSQLNLGGPAVSGYPFVASFDAGGAHRWSVGGGGGLVTGYYGSLALDGSGNTYFTGYYSGTIALGGTTLAASGKSDIFFASVDASGAYRWAKGVGGVEDNEGSGVAVDGSGNVYVSGGTSGTSDLGGGAVTAQGWGDPFVASYTPARAHRWSRVFPCPGSGFAWSVAVDASGNVYVLGDFSGTCDFGGGPVTSQGSDDIFLASFSSTGAHRWSKSFGGADWDSGAQVLAGPAGALYLTGTFGTTIDFGGGPLAAKGSGDLFVAVLSTNGDHLWSAGYGRTGGSAAGTGVALDGTGGVYVSGDFSGTLALGSDTHATTGTGGDAFLLKLTR